MIGVAWRLARRELRGGVRGFRVFLACLALGVAITAGVGSLAEALKAGLARDARILLGGDVEITLFSRALEAEALTYLAQESRALSHVVTMRGMARAAEPGGRARGSLIELKAIDGAYPLLGTLRLADDQPFDEALAGSGAVADRALFDRLGLEVGDAIRVGAATLTLRGVIEKEPDRVTGGIALGPRVMIAGEALAATKLVQPGVLLRHRYRVLVPEAASLGAWTDALDEAFPESGWRVRDARDANPGLRRQLDRVGLFLTLVGLSALFVGGIGVASAVSSHLQGKVRTIATLKCVGATHGTVQLAFLLQITLLALVGIAIGLALGAAAPPVLSAIFGDRLPVPLAGGIYGGALGLATAYGLLTMLAFSLWPLGQAARTPPGLLFRAAVAPHTGWPPLVSIAATAFAALALGGLAVATASRPSIALWFVLGALFSLALFRGAAAMMKLLARLARRAQVPALRLGLANLGRPGAPTVPVAMSLGAGLAVLVAIALVQGNLGAQITEQRDADRPSYFFLDIQPNQVEPFDALLADTPGAERGQRVPMLRGRIVRINDVPVAEATIAPGSRWVVQSDLGLSYAAEPPVNAEIVAGAWWPAGYRGEPLISFSNEVARDFGIGVGDSLSINILGREIKAKITSLRTVDWTAFDVNFVVIFSPGVLESAPQTHLATARATPEAEPLLERAVADRFANVTAIPVRAIVDALDDVFSRIGVAIQSIAGLTVIAGVLVLAGAIAAGHERRVYDAIVLKVLGARRVDLLRIFLFEHVLLGCITAAVAIGIGTAAAYAFVTQVLDLPWSFLPSYVAVTAVGCILITLFFGFASTWRALGRKAAPLLRVE